MAGACGGNETHSGGRHPWNRARKRRLSGYSCKNGFRSAVAAARREKKATVDQKLFDQQCWARIFGLSQRRTDTVGTDRTKDTHGDRFTLGCDTVTVSAGRLPLAWQLRACTRLKRLVTIERMSGLNRLSAPPSSNKVPRVRWIC